MGFHDYAYPESDKSFLSREEVLDFLEKFARDFNLMNFIKFRHQVIHVRPVKESQWEVFTIR